MKKEGISALLVFLFGAILFASNAYSQAGETSIDIDIVKESYSSGEEVEYSIILYSNEKVPVNDFVDVRIYDAKGMVTITEKIAANKLSRFHIDGNYPSGYWTIEASYGEREVSRLFIVKANEGVRFSVEGNTLIIENTGNIPYNREIHIAIGNKLVTYNPEIGIGEKKEIKLVAPEGIYVIEVTDGNSVFKRENVALTGEVIGFLDESETKTAPFFRVFDPSEKSQNYSSQKYTLAMTFVIMVFAIFVAVNVIRRVKRRQGS
jgi:hypothetical protein